jgi:hypothetical protein
MDVLVDYRNWVLINFHVVSILIKIFARKPGCHRS